MTEKATKMGDSVWMGKTTKRIKMAWRENPLEASRFRHSATWQATGLCNSQFWSVYPPSRQRQKLLSYISLNHPIDNILTTSSVRWWTSFLRCSRQRNTKVWHQKLPVPCCNPTAHEELAFLPSVTAQIVLVESKIFKTISPLLV